MKYPKLSILAVVFVLGTAFGIYVVNQDRLVMVDDAQAELSPVAARERDAYFPNSEDLDPDEMRVIACGTGMPTARPSQAAA